MKMYSKFITGGLASLLLAGSLATPLLAKNDDSVRIVTTAVPQDAAACARYAMEQYLSFYTDVPDAASVARVSKTLTLGDPFALYNRQSDGDLIAETYFMFPVFKDDDVVFVVDVYKDPSSGKWVPSGVETPKWLTDLKGKPGDYKIYVDRTNPAAIVPFTALKIDTALDPQEKTAQLYPTESSPNASLYRLYNPNNGEHFYTEDSNERSVLDQAGWKDEGTGWVAPVSGSPVYRIYNPNSGEHHYTQDANERKVLVERGWKDEGIGFYSDSDQGVAVYRLFNSNAKDAGSHMYTTSKDEADTLENLGWSFEGIGWYADLEGWAI